MTQLSRSGLIVRLMVIISLGYLWINDHEKNQSLIDTLKNQYSIDLQRVYVTGGSMGGAMAYRIACELSHRIAGIASVAGWLPSSIANNCNPLHSMPVLHIHGTKDTFIPFESVDQS